jgi:hypothetical protein
MRKFLAEVQTWDEDATWVEGQGIQLSTGKLLHTVQAARKYIQFCADGEPGEWHPTTAAEYDALEALDVEPYLPPNLGPERENGARTDGEASWIAELGPCPF